MIYFDSDYLEGAHPAILAKLTETNLEQTPGYGNDKYCENARAKIKAACNCPQAQVYFISGGTQTNATVIDTLLASYQGVIAAQTGHIAAHEAGAVEFCGHKVITLPEHNGKLNAVDVEDYLETFYADESWEHMVIPGAVYISHPTEWGTLYTKQELQKLSEVCHKYDIPLFLDGARLGYGLTSDDTDVTLHDIAQLCDVFYIGGTKVGALLGEAVVITKPNLIPHFFTSIKQHGALLAKGRVLGIQFDVLFTDDLYLKIARNAIDKANKMKEIFKAKQYRFYLETPTNQQFIIMENSKMQELRQKISFSFWAKYDENHTIVRFATSWATTDEAIKELESIL
ncbi:low specificity L-threonine aldolase [Megamonas hypermegale]|uniref:Aminotransferase class V-fold PLP-dependent enzyme n=1 Tax=Megamonas hypermegale TaxID=158847 RepID=A0A921HND0_9FIRM|nr:aminotransferase class V-fold PLP-dependent enzyme [Megamonas hypermegale]HJF84921.1 aminotransferase class V-fold PLP-dependent enzyme [Megamonas hypermegale]